jgi:hypothetical protein
VFELKGAGNARRILARAFGSTVRTGCTANTSWLPAFATPTGPSTLSALLLRTPNRGPSFARCLIAIAVAADLDSMARKKRAVAADERRMEERGVAVLRTSERRAYLAARTMSVLHE